MKFLCCHFFPIVLYLRFFLIIATIWRSNQILPWKEKRLTTVDILSHVLQIPISFRCKILIISVQTLKNKKQIYSGTTLIHLAKNTSQYNNNSLIIFQSLPRNLYFYFEIPNMKSDNEKSYSELSFVFAIGSTFVEKSCLMVRIFGLLVLTVCLP